MLEFLAITAVAVVVLIIALLAYAATRPAELHVRRATRIEAPPERIFPFINDFHRWGAWSPYEKRDPAMKRTHRGAAYGKGAVYEWDGNKDVGQGSMEITGSSLPSRVAIQLSFVRPFKCQNTVEFTLEPQGGATDVAWDMRGRNSYMTKLMCIFINMDRMIGKDFEAGLASLKAVAEKDVAGPAANSHAPERRHGATSESGAMESRR